MLTVVTPAESHDLIALEVLKDELQVPASDPSDDYLADLIRQASAAIATHLNRIVDDAPALVRQSYRQTERLTASPEAIVLAADIKPSVTSVTVDGEALDTDEFERDGALLYRLEDDRRVRWTAGTKVVIEYDAGFDPDTDLPADIERACIEACKDWRERRGKSGNLRSESAEGIGAVSYLDPRAGAADLPNGAVDRLKPWRLEVWG